MEKKKGKKLENKVLVGVLVGLVVVIVGLMVGVVQLNSGKKEDVVGDLDWAEEFSEKINDRLSSEADYNSPQALEDYQDAFEESTGERKFYLGLEYARYACEYAKMCELAIEVLNGVERVNSTYGNVMYYDTMAFAYEKMGDIEKSKEYRGMILEIAKGDGEYDDEYNEEDEVSNED